MNTSCFSGVEKGFANIFSIIRKFATLITATNLLLRQKQTTNEYVFFHGDYVFKSFGKTVGHMFAREIQI